MKRQIDFNNIDGLREYGFEGFMTKDELFADSSSIPDHKGVYFILRDDSSSPVYLEIGSGGYFKKKNPNAALLELTNNWVEGVKLLYIGKANNLRKRLRQYFAFGQGKNVGHWGGRYIWQLADSRKLVVCWKTLDDADARAVEKLLINEFREKYGSRPFANLAD